MICNSARCLTLQVPADKVDERRQLAESMLDKPMTSRKVLQRFTGKTFWAAGFIPQLKPFVRMLFAAMNLTAGHALEQGAAYKKQLEPPLSWIVPVLHGFKGGMTRKIFAHFRHQCQLGFLLMHHLGVVEL